jgi:hypothetical protein
MTLLGVIFAMGCGDQESETFTPYQGGQAMVIGERDGGELTEVDDDCQSSACAAVRERCSREAFADVVLDDEAEVIDVICYAHDQHVLEVGRDPVDSAHAGNNTVLVLDGDDDGDDVTGDVTLEGNNVIVYGSGDDVSVIGGTLAIEKNNAIVRGVRIRGDVTISKNNAKLLFTTIEGDLTISGNNTTLAASSVLGQLTILGNNTVLVDNELSGEGTIEGKNPSCHGNVRIGAADEVDGAFDERCGD